MTSADDQPHGHIFSATAAANAVGVSRTTIVRKAVAGDIAGAERNHNGQWEIPLSGLIAAGYRPGRPQRPEDTEAQELAAVTIAKLQGQVEVERTRREALESRVQDIQRLADERAERIGELQRMIEPPVSDGLEESAPVAPGMAQGQLPAPTTKPPTTGRLARIWHAITSKE